VNQILLGEQLRAARIARNVSLRSVAAAIGVSPSLLSQIENGKTNPSVDTLYALVQQLDVSVDAIMGIDAGSPAGTGSAAAPLNVDTVVQRLADTPVIEMEHGVRWERLAVLPGQDVEALRVTYQPGAASSTKGHQMEHWGYEHLAIVSGELRVEIGTDTFVLQAGDSMAFDSRRPHMFTNTAETAALGIWFMNGRQAQLAHEGTTEASSDKAGAPVSARDVLRSFRDQ